MGRTLLNPNNHKDLRSCVEDALIIAGYAFFSTLAVQQNFSFEQLYLACVAFGLALFTQLAYEKRKNK
jgi:hypothetical protein